jgi:hypothetical protein
MKRTCFALAIVLAAALPAGQAFAAGEAVTLDSVGGLFATDTVLAGNDVQFWIRLTNPDTKYAISNGFRVYSPDGAVWDTTVGDSFTYDGSVILGKANFAFGYNISSFSADGVDDDTIGFFAAGLTFDALLPAGFDSVPLSVTARFAGDLTQHGKSICIDSVTFFPPGGTWKWVLGSTTVFPTWDGPHCLAIFDPEAAGGNELAVFPIAADTLMYTAVEGGGNPPAQQLTITETSGGNIPFTIAPSATGTWIDLNPADGTTPMPVNVTPIITGLAPNTYVDSVAVSADADNSPVWRYVKLTVDPAPKVLVVTPAAVDTLMFTAVEGGANPAGQILSVSEQGGAAIAFTAAPSATGTWIVLSPTGGSTPDNVTVTPNVGSLAPAVYVDSVQISSAEAGNSPLWRYVKLTVTPAPRILVVLPPANDTLMFTAVEGGANPPVQELFVTEQGAAPISFTVAPSPTGTWISLNPTGGTTPLGVDVTPIVGSMIEGVYVDSVIISSAEADNSPLWRYVKLTVTLAPRTLVVTPDTLSWNISEGYTRFHSRWQPMPSG